MDPYSYADQLRILMGAQLSAAGIPLPPKQYVGAGPLPVWDFDEFVVHLVRSFQGAPGAENSVQGNGFDQRSLEFVVSIVRTVPTVDDYGVAPTPEKMAPYVQQNMRDVAALTDGAIAIKENAVWVDNNTPFSIGPCTTQGPEGGMLAAVISVAIQVFN